MTHKHQSLSAKPVSQMTEAERLQLKMMMIIARVENAASVKWLGGWGVVSL